MNTDLLPAEEWALKRAIVEAFAETNRITKACKSVGVRLRQVRKWREEDEEFDAVLEEIQRVYVEEVEERLDDHSRNGKSMPQVVATLAILHAYAPDLYKRPGDTGKNAPTDINVTVKLEPQPVPNWKQIEAG